MMSSAEEDDWMAAAMADSGVVAELLVFLKRAHAAASAAAAPVKPAIVPPVRWGVRQPRSRTAPRCDAPAAAASQRKDTDSARNSPTTPLSWSGGAASPSATADGFEESSLPANRSSSGSARSKVIAPNDASSLAVNKLRKKKTFAELKDEESYLLNERIHLNKDIARLREAFTEQRARNESLKRMKHDLNLLSGKGDTSTADDRDEATSGLHDKMEASTSDHPASPPSPKHDTSKCRPSSSFCKFPQTVVKDSDSSFLLPDLNVMPSEEDSRPEYFHGLS
ncbi:uncharacterized protein LOC115743454 isoform X2 [Rhodamnia argentea]|nr:uncharacterized protein LOC115743454 isoform X2 [Rhodamnia argentea]